MASSWWPSWLSGKGASSLPPTNFLHLSRTNVEKICQLTLNEVPLNPHQCKSMSSKLRKTMQSIESYIVGSSSDINLVCGSLALENFYRVSEKAKQLVEKCCSVDWWQESAFQIQNEEAFKEILLETSLGYDTIRKLLKDINSKRFLFEDFFQYSTFDPPSADDVFKDRVALQNRLEGLVNAGNMSFNDIQSQHLGKYLLGRVNFALRQSNDEDFDVRSFNLWSDGKGPDGEWSKESEYLGGNVSKTTWLGVPCAKKLFKDAMQEGEWSAEAKILASLNHPNIVKFLCCNKYETIHTRGHFIAMEQMETSLDSFILWLKDGESKLSLFQALDVILQIAYGMCYIHEHGIAHRDLKTSNVVVRHINAPHLEGYLEVKIVDFGISKGKLSQHKSNTITRPRIGTTLYMPPEAFSHGRANWFKADVYSFSVMCSVILSGEEPFPNIMRGDLCEAIFRGDRPRLPSDTPIELASLIMEGWAMDRDSRPNFMDICTRLEELRHHLLRKHSLGLSWKQADQDYSSGYIQAMLQKRSEARELEYSHSRLQRAVKLLDEEEWFDGEEMPQQQQVLDQELFYRQQQELLHLQATQVSKQKLTLEKRKLQTQKMQEQQLQAAASVGSTYSPKHSKAFGSFMPYLQRHQLPEQYVQLSTVYQDFKEHKMTKEDFVRLARAIAGEQLFSHAIGQVRQKPLGSEHSGNSFQVAGTQPSGTSNQTVYTPLGRSPLAPVGQNPLAPESLSALLSSFGEGSQPLHLLGSRLEAEDERGADLEALAIGFGGHDAMKNFPPVQEGDYAFENLFEILEIPSMILMFLALLATASLTQLFFFHLILMHKGITTYDYIPAVRDEDQEFWEDNGGSSSLTTSPATSTETGFSGYNSSASKRIVFCTPPRMFVDQDQTIMALSDLEVGASKAGAGKIIDAKASKQSKAQVGLYPWKLAINANRAAARARAKSSILHASRPGGGTETTLAPAHPEVDTDHSSGVGEIRLAGSRSRKKPPRLQMWSWKNKQVSGTSHLDSDTTVINPNFFLEGLPALPLEPRSPYRSGNNAYPGDPRASFPAPQAPFPILFPRFPGDAAGLTRVPESSAADIVRVSVNSDGYEASCGESGDDTSDAVGLSQSWNKCLWSKPAEPEHYKEEDVKPWVVNFPAGSSQPDAVGRPGGRSVSSGSRVEASILKVKPELQHARLQSSSSPTVQEDSPLRESSDFLSEDTTTSYGETQDRSTMSSFFYMGPEAVSIRATSERQGVSNRMSVNSIIAARSALSRVTDDPKLLVDTP